MERIFYKMKKVREKVSAGGREGEGEGGQTLIETVFVLLLILIILFAIAEFARGWYLKNSLNNAARIGARVAVVDGALVEDLVGTLCPSASTKTLETVCAAPGVPSGATVTVDIRVPGGLPGSGSTPPVAGEVVTVSILVSFTSSTSGVFTVVPNLFPGLDMASMSSEASMRYE
ncbi:MAG: TadE/TadG family type IV pilus assembly protein [Thermodesulfobacteriota bacterium]